MTDRKQQILQEACGLLAAEGCGAFTMRAVARASGLKLGALQYHFRTRADLLGALADFVAEAYHADFARFLADGPPPASRLHALLDYMRVETVTTALQTQRLFPQLWALAMVEPPLQAALDAIYARYLATIEESLSAQGVPDPRGDALALLSMLEGLTLFVDPGRRWAADAGQTVAAIRALLDARYGDPATPAP